MLSPCTIYLDSLCPSLGPRPPKTPPEPTTTVPHAAQPGHS